jgi:hypothetical protein
MMGHMTARHTPIKRLISGTYGLGCLRMIIASSAFDGHDDGLPINDPAGNTGRVVHVIL